MSSRPSIIVEKPIDTARNLLGECLGKLQDIHSPGLDVETLIANVAKTVKILFDVSKYDPVDEYAIRGVKDAIDSIGKSLATLQDIQSNDPAILEASKILAKVLSIIYPISKAQEALIRPAKPKPAPPKEVPPHPGRKIPRITLNVDIGAQSENNFYTGFSEDISEGGIFMATYDLKPIGTKVNLSFTLPNGYVVMATGTVRWIREYNQMTPNVMPGMGIQFDELSPEDKRQIEQYIKKNIPMFYE